VTVMTAPTSTPSRVELPLPAAQAVCDVCPHAAAAHDGIGRRYCDATLTGALTRGCICRS
jgi:hypothetical protein